MATTATLSATPTTLFIDDPEAQEARTSTVTYVKDRTHRLFTRYALQKWMPHDIDEPDDHAEHFKGEFESPLLRAGSVFEVLITERHVNPNEAMRHIHAHVAIVALRSEPVERDLISDQSHSYGGTWCSHKVAAKSAGKLLATFQVATERWRQDARGHLSFPTVVDEVFSGDFAQFQDLQSEKVMPGGHYFALMRVSDKQGNWQFGEPQEFDALRRTVEVTLQSICVDDDGDDFSNGEGTFTFAMLAGRDIDEQESADPGWKPTGVVLEYHNSNFKTGQLIDNIAGQQMTYGPAAVDASTAALCVEVSGIELEDGSFPFADGVDRTTTERAELYLYTGRGSERVTYQEPKPVKVHDLDGDFRFTAQLSYSVDYVP
jgi:hypothetical protein